MNKCIKQGLLFTAGGAGYVGLELLYRGRSHISMFAAGGSCFLLLGRLRRQERPPAVRALLGGLTVTGVELAAGLLVNRDHSVWDYRRMPMNFRGQICPGFTALWIPLSAAAMGLYRAMENLLEQ